MKLWCGVVTEKIAESKAFYTQLFGCEILFEEDWFVLLKLGTSEIGFLLPGMEGQHPLFQRAYAGEGMWITIDVTDAQAELARFTSLGQAIEQPLRDEPWGDRHFVLRDPNGIGVDVVQRITSPME
ncbi:VOC family protein [Bremerella sp. JC817]|uniref:VOC family protein n=1 Tax=Bremerella sp. JC817 TaxID=3231756 RepID=UPI0034591DFB